MPGQLDRTTNGLIGLGVLAGVVGAALTQAATVSLGKWIGLAIGLVVAGGCGALCVRVLLNVLARRLRELANDNLEVANFEEFREPGQGVEGVVEDIVFELRRSRRLLAEFEPLQRLAGDEAFPGALDHAVASDDAMRIKRVRERLIENVSGYKQFARKAASAADGINLSVKTIEAGSREQSGMVAQTTAAVESFADEIDRISRSAEAAARAAAEAKREAKRGLELVGQLVAGMAKLSDHAGANGRKIQRLGERSVEIGSIVDTIHNLSSRTDILALNATIESVRAGEHGRGFAVVAEEIRKLAERASTASREIAALVEATQAETNESIRAISEEQREVSIEADRARQAGVSLERISEAAEESAGLVEGISHCANDQVRSTHQLVGAIQRISQTSQVLLEGSAECQTRLAALLQLSSSAVGRSNFGFVETRGDRKAIEARADEQPFCPIEDVLDQSRFEAKEGSTPRSRREGMDPKSNRDRRAGASFAENRR